MKLCEMLNKYRQIVRYLFFGGCAAVLNTVCYAVLHEGMNVENVTSTTIAWFAAVIFAYFTNKVFVFKSKTGARGEGLREFSSFFFCRVATGVLDVVIMVIAVDWLGQNSVFWKILSNVVITLLNYIASRFFIFKKK